MPHCKPRSPARTVAPETDYYIPHAHNIELETMAELERVSEAWRAGVDGLSARRSPGKRS